MNILLKYVRSYHLKNKLTTFLSVFSIGVASCLFLIVVCLCVNIPLAIRHSMISSYGNYHAQFTQVSDEFIDSMQLHSQISHFEIVGVESTIPYDSFQKKDKNSYRLFEMDEQTFYELGLLLDEGSYPQNDHEILISDAAIYESKAKLNLNEHLELNGEDYLITGIAVSPFLEENQPFYSIIKPFENAASKDVYVRYQNEQSAHDITTQIQKDFETAFSNCYINESYLSFSGLNTGSLDSFYPAIIYFILASFLAVNLLLIRNAFRNIYANREKHLAILKTIGVTHSQCETMIIYEGLVLMSAGLASGLLGGWFLYHGLIDVVNELLHTLSANSLMLKDEGIGWIMLLCAVYIILFSCLFLRRSTRKIILRSVSSTLQSSDEVVVTERPYLALEVERPILIRLFSKNLRQNFRSYRHLILGITGIMSLLLIINGSMGYLREVGYFDINDHNYDVEMIIVEDHYPTTLMTRLKNSDYATSTVISEVIRLNSSDLSVLDDMYIENTLLQEQMTFEILAYSDNLLEKFAGKNFERLLDTENPTGIVVNQVYNSAYRCFYDILSSDRVYDLTYQNHVIFHELQLIETDNLISGTSYQKNPQILVSNALMAQIIQQAQLQEHEYHIYFQSTTPASLVRELNGYDDGSLNYFDVINANKTLKEGNTMITLIRLIGYGYVALLIIMGVLAALCVTSINFEYRRKELILYHVLGLRLKDMMKLIFMELLFYAMIIFIGSWLIALSINYFLYSHFFASLGLKFFVPINSLSGSLMLMIIAIAGMLCYIYIKMRFADYSSVLKNEISLM